MARARPATYTEGMKRLRRALHPLRTAIRSSAEDRVSMMGAALAFYAVFSIAPLLVISMGVAGLFFGDRGGAELLDSLSAATGSLGAQAILSLVKSAARRPHAGLVATAVGLITLLIGASGVFRQLHESLNAIWKAPPAPRAAWAATARRSLLSFGMVGVIALLLLASLLATAALAAAGKFIGPAVPGGAASWQAVNALVSFSMIAGLFALTFKLVPDARPSWRAALRGGFCTSLLFTAGQYALGLYLGRTAVASTYGAAGSLVALLLWVYYSAQILLFGAELTRAFSLGESIPAEGPGADGQEQRRHRGQNIQVRRDLGQGRALGHHRARRVDQVGQRHRVGEQP